MTKAKLWKYPQAYRGPRGIDDQIERIADLFSLNPKPALALARQGVPTIIGSEGLFAIPRFDKVHPGPYWEVAEFAWRKLGREATSTIISRGVDWERLRRCSRSAKAYLSLVDIFSPRDSDIFLVPAQFGLFYAGDSVDQVRLKVPFQGPEFCLGAFEVACMLLTHPQRLAGDALAIDIAGDDYKSTGEPNEGLVVDVVGGRIVLSSAPVQVASAGSGSVTGWIIER